MVSSLMRTAGEAILGAAHVDRGVLVGVVAQDLERLAVGVGHKFEGGLERGGALLALGVGIGQEG